MLRPLAGLALAALLASCATVAPSPEAESPLFWPGEPDPPRIAFVRQFSTPAEFGIAPGLVERLVSALAGESEARLVRPMAVVEAGGAVFVGDPGAMAVHRFDPKAGRHDLIYRDDGNILPSPVGLAPGAEGEVFVADSSLRAVLVIRPGARAAATVALPPMGQPTGIAYDPGTRRLYVVDTTAHRVNVFGSDGRLHAAFGQRGVGDGEFNYPTRLWRDARGRLFVVDSLNFRIQLFDAEGRFLKKFGQVGDGSGDFLRHKAVSTDAYGHVYIVDALQNAVQIFDDSGVLLMTLGEPGRGRGEFWMPSDVFVGQDDHVFVADTYNRRVQVFRYIGGSQ